MAAIDDVRDTLTDLRVEVAGMGARVDAHERRDEERHTAVMAALVELRSEARDRSAEGRRPRAAWHLPDAGTVGRLAALVGLGASTLATVVGGGYAAYQSATAALPPVEVHRVDQALTVPPADPVGPAPRPVEGPE